MIPPEGNFSCRDKGTSRKAAGNKVLSFPTGGPEKEVPPPKSCGKAFKKCLHCQYAGAELPTRVSAQVITLLLIYWILQ